MGKVKTALEIREDVARYRRNAPLAFSLSRPLPRYCWTCLGTPDRVLLTKYCPNPHCPHRRDIDGQGPR